MVRTPLLPPADRQAYGEQIVSWASQAIEYYADRNWQRAGTGWRCLRIDPQPPAIDYQAGDVRLHFALNLDHQLQHGKRNDRDQLVIQSPAQVRREVMRIARRLLEQGSPAARRQLREISAGDGDA